jgi:phage shock protein A
MSTRREIYDTLLTSDLENSKFRETIARMEKKIEVKDQFVETLKSKIRTLQTVIADLKKEKHVEFAEAKNAEKPAF